MAVKPPTVKQLLNVLNNKKDLMNERQVESLWDLYFVLRDNTGFPTPRQLEYWEEFLAAEKGIVRDHEQVSTTLSTLEALTKANSVAIKLAVEGSDEFQNVVMESFTDLVARIEALEKLAIKKEH